jgi:hydroxymethylpyrimidine/phosphomethylpyrimidine kinase
MPFPLNVIFLLPASRFLLKVIAMSQSLPIALSIAGSDSGGGAGIQADLLTFAAHGVYGTTAITCLTAQNPEGVTAVHASPAEIVREQIQQVLRYYPVKAIKTGMLFDAAIIRAVVAVLKDNAHIPLIVDPVMVASSGARLLQEDAMSVMINELIPFAHVVTPNLDEAEILLGKRPRETEVGMMVDAAELAKKLGTTVLLKGGHSQGTILRDILVDNNGRALSVCTANRISDVDTHGSGCTLSAGLTARLARGEDLTEAFQNAHAYLQESLVASIQAGPRKQIGH